MPGESISKEEFERWFAFRAAYEALEAELGYDHARAEIRRRLIFGSLRAAARETLWEHQSAASETRHYEVLSPPLWETTTISNQALIWKTGSFDFADDSGRQTLLTMCQGIRLEPSGVALIVIDTGTTLDAHSSPILREAVGMGAVATDAEPAKPIAIPALRGPSIGESEMVRIATLIHQLWGMGMTEEKATRIAQAAYPDNSVSRTQFLTQYRLIRGDKKRGKQPLRGE